VTLKAAEAEDGRNQALLRADVQRSWYAFVDRLCKIKFFSWIILTYLLYIFYVPFGSFKCLLL
jgi:hypothetical protein